MTSSRIVIDQRDGETLVWIHPVGFLRPFCRFLPHLVFLLGLGGVLTVLGSRWLILMSGDTAPPDFRRTIVDEWKAALFVVGLIGAAYLFLVASHALVKTALILTRDRLKILTELAPYRHAWVSPRNEISEVRSRGRRLRIYTPNGSIVLSLDLGDRQTAQNVADILHEFFR